MRRIKLPDGTYLNPSEVKKVEISKHFFGENFYVSIVRRNAPNLEIEENLTRSAAEKIKRRYEIELEKLHAEIPAFEDGYGQGRHEGERSGYQAGYENGFREGRDNVAAIAWSEAERAGIERVLALIEAHRRELTQELSYGVGLSAGRRLSLGDMLGLLGRISDACAASSEADEK